MEQVTVSSSVPSEESGQAGEPERNSARETASDARVQTISPARYKVTFAASAGLRDKLDRLRELTLSSHHGGDRSPANIRLTCRAKMHPPTDPTRAVLSSVERVQGERV